ncbi:MAG: thermonuclease family protein [Betaproteobacteria bacterium]
MLSLPAAAETISGTVITVIDGDTLTLADAAKKPHRVRLVGIDAPEAKQPFGVRSARSLAQLCFKKEAKVEWKDRERGLLLGQVSCGDKDANAEQVRRGMAWVSPRQAAPGATLYEAEAYARLRKLGLWADEKAVPPWEWRATGAGKAAK